MTLAAVCIAATLIVLLATGYAWHDYRTRPHRYLRQTNHTDTRRPVKQWTARWIRR